MSCPFAERVDWQRLGEESAAAEAFRDELRPHLRVCGSCRDRAVLADASMFFAAMPAVEVSASERSEMQQRIAGARRLLAGAPPAPLRRRLVPRLSAGRVAAVLVPALALAGLWGGSLVREPEDPSSRPALVEETATASALHASHLAQHLEGMPLVDRSEDDAPEIVYQVEGATFDLVLLVHAGLDLGGP
ncbi:MAG TPA: hypothetical protein VNB06_18510 [Thermoanaerobaculia bacterium]|nr:hypothetical protein [Thermoanaerobaculia bacterium]